MGWKKLVGCVFLLGMSSCFLVLQNYYNKENGGIRPKKPRFSLAKNPYYLQKGDVIDTQSVYIRKYEVTHPDKTQKEEESFIRFFSNGRYLSGVPIDSRRGYLLPEDFEDITRGGTSIGYFKLENHTQIIIESFWVHESIGHYVKKYGYIRNDSIFLFTAPPLGGRGKTKPDESNSRIYVRRKIEGLTGTPDW